MQSLPENNLKRNQELVTEIFKCIMDHLNSTDVLSENSMSTSQLNTIIQNVYSFIDRLVQKLWDGKDKIIF